MACEEWTSTTTQVGKKFTASAVQKSTDGVRRILESMRSLEVHVFETDRDVDLALSAGIVLPEQLARTECVQCSEPVCYSGVSEFYSFVLVIDENDQDWTLCENCASAITDYVDTFFPPVVKSHFEDPDEIEYF